jgi:hypothetical protein
MKEEFGRTMFTIINEEVMNALKSWKINVNITWKT